MLSNYRFSTKYHDSSITGKVTYAKNMAKTRLVFQCLSRQRALYADLPTSRGAAEVVVKMKRPKFSFSELRPFSRYAPENSAPAAIRIHEP